MTRAEQHETAALRTALASALVQLKRAESAHARWAGPAGLALIRQVIANGEAALAQ